MPGAITVREMLPRDADEVVILFSRYSPIRLDATKIANIVTRFPACVAVHEDSIIGFCYTQRFAPDVLEIRNIYVDLPFRARGVGNQLMDSIVMASKLIHQSVLIAANSFLNPCLEVKRSPTSFYLRNGFHVIYANEKTTIYLREISRQNAGDVESKRGE